MRQRSADLQKGVWDPTAKFSDNLKPNGRLKICVLAAAAAASKANRRIKVLLISGFFFSSFDLSNSSSGKWKIILSCLGSGEWFLLQKPEAGVSSTSAAAAAGGVLGWGVGRSVSEQLGEPELISSLTGRTAELGIPPWQCW